MRIDLEILSSLDLIITTSIMQSADESGVSMCERETKTASDSSTQSYLYFTLITTGSGASSPDC